jgi:tetratricopeptide (TPR) repeat protein
MRIQSWVGRVSIGAMAVSVAVASTRAQGSRPSAPDTLVRQVRTAIGHGAVSEAHQLVSGAAAPTSKELATALVEIFEGKDDQARARLKPLADKDRLGEAALELGLLELRHGRRDAGRALLEPLASQRTFSNADDYYRLARAARATREFLLANDAYMRTVDAARPDIQTEGGDLALERHQYADAAKSYQKALAADAAWVPAHLGLARAFADDNPKAAQAQFEAARKIAPDDPDVWLLAAEQQVEGEDYTSAAHALDRLATLRPGSLDEAAERAAVAYAQHHPAEVDAAIARAHDIDPTSAKGYRLAGWQASQDYRFDDAVAFAQKAIATDGDDPDAHFDLGLYSLRTGEEKTARTELERAWALDKSNRVTLNLLTMLDKLDAFEVVPDGDLIFKFAKDEAAVLKPYALPLGELAYKTFSAHYGFTPKGPILIEVFPTHDDFAVRTIGLPGIAGALGACFGRVVSMDSPRARAPGDFSWQATLWHELAHVFTLQLSEYRVPRWLTEGISVFEEHRKNAPWGRELTLQYAHELGQGQGFGVKGLPEAFKHPESLALAYFEASLVVEHLVELNGDAGLRTLLLAYADGASDDQAFTKAFGKSWDAVDASFKAFVDQHYGSLRDAMKDPPTDVDPKDLTGLRVRAAAAPGNFVSQVTFGQALLAAGDVAAAKAPLDRAATLAPQALGADSPHALLAEIAIRQGDPSRARKELRALLLVDHTNVAAARRLAALGIEGKAVEDEDVGLRLVADLDPFDAETHGLLGAREMATGNFAGALVEFEAALALGPANLAEAHTNVGEALLKLNRRDEAKREALLALVEAPSYARAQELLLAAMGKQ